MTFIVVFNDGTVYTSENRDLLPDMGLVAKKETLGMDKVSRDGARLMT